MNNFPNDADGDVLRSLAAKGVDLSKPRKIEFYCYASDNEVAKKIVAILKKLDFVPHIYEDENDKDISKRFSVYSEKIMIPSYENVIETQNTLNQLLANYGTVCDGWGTMSNPDEHGKM